MAQYKSERRAASTPWKFEKKTKIAFPFFTAHEKKPYNAIKVNYFSRIMERGMFFNDLIIIMKQKKKEGRQKNAGRTL